MGNDANQDLVALFTIAIESTESNQHLSQLLDTLTESLPGASAEQQDHIKTTLGSPGAYCMIGTTIASGDDNEVVPLLKAMYLWYQTAPWLRSLLLGWIPVVAWAWQRYRGSTSRISLSDGSNDLGVKLPPLLTPAGKPGGRGEGVGAALEAVLIGVYHERVVEQDAKEQTYTPPSLHASPFAAALGLGSGINSPEDSSTASGGLKTGSSTIDVLRPPHGSAIGATGVAMFHPQRSAPLAMSGQAGPGSLPNPPAPINRPKNGILPSPGGEPRTSGAGVSGPSPVVIQHALPVLDAISRGSESLVWSVLTSALDSVVRELSATAAAGLAVWVTRAAGSRIGSGAAFGSGYGPRGMRAEGVESAAEEDLGLVPGTFKRLFPLWCSHSPTGDTELWLGAARALAVGVHHGASRMSVALMSNEAVGRSAVANLSFSALSTIKARATHDLDAKSLLLANMILSAHSTHQDHLTR